MKDVSANGGTHKVGGNESSQQYQSSNDRAESSNEYKREDNSYKSQESGQQHSTHKSREEQIKEYKNILGIDENVELTKDIIKKAKRKKTIEWHPDRNPDNIQECTEMMQKINEAVEELEKLLK